MDIYSVELLKWRYVNTPTPKYASPLNSSPDLCLADGYRVPRG